MTYQYVAEKFPTTAPPDSENVSPAIWENDGAQQKDQLGELIDRKNKPLAGNLQERVCDNCGNSFAPRTGNGGRPQKFCSPACRREFHNGTASGHPSNAPDVGENVSKDVGKVVGAQKLAAPISRPADDSDSAEFRWNDEDTVIPTQPAIAVYFNPHGEIVIRQEGQYGYDEDHWIYIRPQNLRFLIRRLEEIENGSGPF